MNITSVKHISAYTISISFEDGTTGMVNLQDLISKGVFRVLKDQKKFAEVYTTGYSVAWSDELEIDALSLYLEITGKHFEDLANPKFSHAAD